MSRRGAIVANTILPMSISNHTATRLSGFGRLINDGGSPIKRLFEPSGIQTVLYEILFKKNQYSKFLF